MKKSIAYSISLFVFLQKNKFKNCNMKQSSFFTVFVFILLFSNVVQAQYCIPTSGGGSCITNVTVGTINNSTTGCPSSVNNYNWFNSSFVFYQGTSNTLSISCSNIANTGVWIDFDHNMVLDPTEYFSGFTNALNGTINITVPGTAMMGTTLLRIRSSDTSTYIGVTDACNTFLSGETEDYSIIIAASCIGTPDAGITVATSNPICGGMMDTLSLLGATVAPGLGYTWQRAACPGGAWASLLNSFGASYVCIPPMGGTWRYHCIVTCLNTGTYDTSVAICITTLNVPTSTSNFTVCQNQLPYAWNGQLLTTAGLYSDTLFSAGMNGCDSISLLNFSINIPTQTSSLSVCQNQLPYLWNGQLLTTAGTYTDTLLNAGINGCDSISILNFSIDIPTQTNNLSVCQNQLPYVWNGQLLTTAGLYSDTLLNASANGCDSVSILNFSIDIPTQTSSLSVCQNQLPYSWNGQLLTTAGLYSDTLLNAGANGCDSISILNFSINIPTQTSSLSVCQNQLPYTWNGQLLTIAGIYSDTLLNASANGCDSISILNLSIYPTPTHTGTLSVCPNQLPYFWYGQFLSTAGTYSHTFLNVSMYGCDSISIVNFSINPSSTFTGSLSICQNQLPYVWNGQLYSTAGIYSDTLLNAGMNGCDSIIILNLSINPMPDTTTTLSGTTITSNQVSMPSSYQWIDCSNNQPINSATANSFTATTNGSYAVVVSNVFCTDTSACVTVTTVGVDNTKGISNIHVFPNPTSSILYIDLNNATSQNITFKLLDMSGRIANQKTVKVNSGLQHFNMNMAELPKGIYTLEVYEDGQRVYVQKVESKK